MQEQTCAQCGGTVVTADVLTGGSPVLLVELYATTPDVLR